LSERSVPRAPSRDGAVVAVPPLREAGNLLAANRRRLLAHAEKRTLLGRPWTDLRRHARASAIAAALKYLGEPVTSTVSRESLLLAGHQPELFHPGVWVKNFALCGLARVHGATPLNLVVDNDTVKTTALRLPAPPHVRRVRFDRWTGATPYEERTLVDRALFADFAGRVGETTRAWPFEPLLPAFWREVLRQSERTANLGECFAAARRTFERAWGCDNLEVPLSTLCDTEPFAWFAYHLLADLPHFHSLYNSIVADYRLGHGIRDHQHPVPDLAIEGDWLEAPFWVWRAGTSRRERLFVRNGNDGLELRVGEDCLRWSAQPQAAVKAWQQLPSQGIKIRSRALTTTLYARLFLSDLFIHGIGGGIYDELTDDLMRRFYECEPPEYLVLSATLWLPLPRSATTEDEGRRLRRELRDVRYNPQRHLDEIESSEELAALAARKQEWIARQPATRAERRERFRMLRSLTEELRHSLLLREEQLRQEWRQCQRHLRVNAVLQRRDYSFCLYPESVLRPFCTQFLGEGTA
jgi:hypothetical protein